MKEHNRIYVLFCSLFCSFQLSPEASLLLYPPPGTSPSWIPAIGCPCSSLAQLIHLMGCEAKAPSAPTVTKWPWLLALWPPTREKPTRLTSPVISSLCWSPWPKKMDWARQTRHELKILIEPLALILLLQVDRQRSKFPPPPPTIAQWHTKDSYLVTFGTTNSSDQFVLKTYWATTLPSALFVCLAVRLPADPPPAQTGKNTRPSITRDHMTKHSSTNWPPPICFQEKTWAVP